MVKISRCWRKFVVLFLKACFFCLRSFQRSTWSENGMGRYQGYFRVCRWNWSKRKLANICKCNSSFFCCQHSKPRQWFWRLATLPRWTDQLLSFIGLQYVCLQSLASHVCFLVLFSINVLEPNCQTESKTWSMTYDHALIDDSSSWIRNVTWRQFNIQELYKNGWIQQNGMNSCDTHHSLSPHLDVLLWCLYVFSQGRIFQWRRFRVALPKLLIVWKIFFSSFSLDCKEEIEIVGHQIRLPGDDNFSAWQKKRNKKSSVRICGRAYFV